MVIWRRAQRRAEAIRAHRYGPNYSVGATYYDAMDEAIRRGDRAIGTEHLVLALLVDPASPAAKAIGCDLQSARRALDALDNQALAEIGVQPGVIVGPVEGPMPRRLRLTPPAKAILTIIRDARRRRGSILGTILSALLELQAPDPGAELLAALGVDANAAQQRFAQFVNETPL